MMNNEEIVVYTEESPDNSKKMPHGQRLVLSRPVAEDEEINPKYRGYFADEPVGKYTFLLDAVHRMRKQVAFEKEYMTDWTPQKFLEHWLAYQYYDYMSGGMKIAEIAIVHELVKAREYDLSAPVYPGKNYNDPAGPDWFTIQDFLDESGEDLDLEPYRAEMGRVRDALNF